MWMGWNNTVDICTISPIGQHEFVDLGADHPHVPQDVCIWCGFSRLPNGGENRTYSSNVTAWLVASSDAPDCAAGLE